MHCHTSLREPLKLMDGGILNLATVKVRSLLEIEEHNRDLKINTDV